MAIQDIPDAAIEQFNGTRSTIFDDINNSLAIPPTADGTIVIGTARRGVLNQITRPSTGDIYDNYGEVTNDPSFDTSLVRSFQEISRSTVNGGSTFVMRIGNAKKAFLNLYESQSIVASGTGDYKHSGDTTTNTLAFSLINEALVEGLEANNGKIEVKDNGGNPSSLTITTPDNVVKTFSLDPFGTVPGAFANVRDIANALNNDPDWNKWYVTKYPLLRQKDLPVTVQSDSQGRIYIEIDSTTESYGNNLENIEEIAIQDPAAQDSIDIGTTVAQLSSIPTKDNLASTKTISKFVRTLTDERVLFVDELTAGGTTISKTLFIGQSGANWVDLGNTAANVFSADPNNAAFDNFKLEIIKTNGNRVEVPKTWDTGTTDANGDPIINTVYTVDANGVINVDMSQWDNKTLELGDTFVARTVYEASYLEANTRSLLEIGNEFSYFVKGDEIIFGSATTLPLVVEYATRKVFDVADYDLLDANNIVIQFINPLNRPAAGDTVLVTFTHLPELPASSGAVLTLPDGTTTVIQPSGFKGGDDGRFLKKLEYKKLVAEALDLIELYPFKQVFIAGAYIDDIEEGYDDETGLPSTVLVDWGSMLIPKIKERSYLVKEATISLPVRPPANFTPESQNIWFDRLINQDPNDPTRPANIIESMKGPDSFRVNVIAGAPIVAISGLVNGNQYVANPAAIISGMKQELPLEESLTHALLPNVVQDLGVSTLNARIIGGMNSRKYTFLNKDAAQNLIIADAPTISVAGSLYDRQYVVEAVFAAIDIVRLVGQRFIGKPRSPENLLALKNKAQREVAFLVPSVFTELRIELLDVPDGFITGRTKLGIYGVTYREIRVVETETRISLQ